MFRHLIVAALLTLCQLTARTQDSPFTLSGKVKDSSSKEALPFVHIVLDDFLNADSDIDGRYQFTNISNGKHKLRIQYLGYADLEKSFMLTENLVMDIELSASNNPGLVVTVPPMREVLVEATRADTKTPMAFSEITSKEIVPLNNGQDMPYLLRFTPSLVATSDAGNGVGYTGLWIRGSDPSRINVTINGIPLNDPESQQVFWVNTPDFGSSTNSIQIQRGIGTSANGSSSFGGSIKLETRGVRSDAYAEINNSYGSFNTWKNKVSFGTGLIHDHFVFEGRLSRIASDGFVDRASSGLKSFFLEGNYLSAKTTVKLTAFGGREQTYQSWNGTPWEVLHGTEQQKLDFASRNYFSEDQTKNLLVSDRSYNFYQYQNQVDNYGQDHFQLHFTHQLMRSLKLNVSGHYTHGQGYFEEYKEYQDYQDYGLSDVIINTDTITSTNLIRRRWLKNDFYGGVFSLIFIKNKLESVLGGAYNEYHGTHFGELTWMQFAGNSFINDHYYDGKSLKRDGNIYWKNTYSLTKKLDIYADVQLRNVIYTTSGTDNDLRKYDISDNLLFFNPKFGLNYQFSNASRTYISIAHAGKEPNRNDYVDAIDPTLVKPEEMTDLEAGYRRNGAKISFGVNGYYMQYQNQLVLTGELNDVGAALRTNVASSFRRGIELDATWKVWKDLSLSANAALSQNKIKRFNEVLYDYTVNEDVINIEHDNTDIAFSPSVIGAAQIVYSLRPFPDQKNEVTAPLTIAVMTKYVGKQFLDNTSTGMLALDPYLVNDVRISYDFKPQDKAGIYINFTVNNFMNSLYASNGYTFSYIQDTRITERFYYPQAGRNYTATIGFKF